MGESTMPELPNATLITPAIVRRKDFISHHLLRVPVVLLVAGSEEFSFTLPPFLSLSRALFPQLLVASQNGAMEEESTDPSLRRAADDDDDSAYLGSSGSKR